MRIISGIHKGRRLIAPKKLPVRPTTDRAKESLFNILRNSYNFSQLEVLDLFSGTGNISYEFVSRGSTAVTAVDQNRHCVNYTSKIAEELEMPIKTVKADVFSFLSTIKATYDLIYADPPYNLDQELFKKIVFLVFEHKLLKDDGMLIIEHSKTTDLSMVSNFVEQRYYGSTSFSFFKSFSEKGQAIQMGNQL